MTYLLDLAHKLANGLRRIKRGDIGLTTIYEICGVATIERALEIRSKRIFATALRCATILILMFADKGIEKFAICGSYVLDVGHIL